MADDKRRLDLVADTENADNPFPSSQKVLLGDLQVPVRVIELSGDEPPVTVYDTSGPDADDPRRGLPKRRAEWMTRREPGPDGNVTQL